MVRWYETLAARVGLRIGGLAVLSAAWLAASRLYAQVHSHPPAAAGWSELGLCTLLVALAVVGSALFIVGPGLWKQVEIPSRWSAALVEPRQFDILLYGDPVVPESQAFPNMKPAPNGHIIRSRRQPDFRRNGQAGV
ncbi:hypothetical protein [Novosphingobium sp. BL-52-GroH]|uniref:hypothetical protein n=1 Tax=Novosphingobium sp. BL-52-GroH TaxID=3349877 RepID=UPI00384EAB58